jgi:hypothetical protein
MRKLAPLAPAILLLTLPVIALAAPTTLKELASQIITLLNAATAFLVAAALVLFLGGAAYNMIRAGERGSAALSKFLIWGIITLFVMVSIWGILNLLQNTLFNSGSADTSGIGGAGAAPVGTNNNVSF